MYAAAERCSFFSFGPHLQALLAVFCLIFLVWASFATVVVIFKDRSIAAWDHRYDEARAAYEDRLATLRTSHDDLAAALARSTHKFAAAVEELRNKQRAIGSLFVGESTLEGGNGTSGVVASIAGALPGADDVAPALTLSAEASLALGYKDDSPRASPDTPITALQAALSRGRELVATLFLRDRDYPKVDEPQNPALREMAQQVERVRLLDRQEIRLAADTGHYFDQRAENLQELIHRTGINPEQYIRKTEATNAVGGPGIPLGQVRITGIADSGFTHAYLGASAALAQLDFLSRAIRHIPFAMPVSAAYFDRTSGFGPRLDPFTRRYSFHPGLDFGGPWGSPVFATAPGIVVSAGERGTYGIMVEIDHGMGIHTRYAHLSATTVRPGMRVSPDMVIGRVGSTGRSTGPHVHYEVWYDDIVRNPALFIKAGGRFISRPIGLATGRTSAIGND